MICNNCLRDKGDVSVCPYCHVVSVQEVKAHHLPKGTVIGRKYTVVGVLGEGGFGITYLARDPLGINVAVKEYYPHGFTYRVSATGTAVSVTESKRDEYEHGKKRFLSEARTLSMFRDEPGIVNVLDYIDENNTAYIVMEYLNGADLREYLVKNGKMSIDRALEMLTPVMKSLVKIHQAGIIHRDISPDNIMRLKSGDVKLMDFGSAKVFDGDVRSMSVMLKPGFAPEEQYRRNGKQGPWTDVYGLCATIYCCITGYAPDDALDRMIDDKLVPPSKAGAVISPEMERVIMYGLAVRSDKRCQSVTELLQLIDSARKSPNRNGRAAYAVDPNRTVDANTPTNSVAWGGTLTQDAEKPTAPYSDRRYDVPRDQRADRSAAPETNGTAAAATKKKAYYPGTALRVVAGVLLALHIALFTYRLIFEPIEEKDLVSALIVVFAIMIFLFYANYCININYSRPLSLWVRIGVYFIAGCYAIIAVPVGVNIAKSINLGGGKASSQSSSSPPKDLTQEAAHDNAVFSAMVDYLEEKIDLSDYDTKTIEDQSYINYDENGNYVECSAGLNFNGKEKFSSPSDRIQLDGGIAVIPDQTRVNNLIANGYSLAKETPTYIEPGKSESIHMFYKSKSVSAWVENRTSSRQRVNFCVITSVYLNPSQDVGFNYQGLNNGSDIDDVLSILRKPNANIFLYSSDDFNSISLRYTYSDGVSIELDFDYVYSTKSTKLRNFSIS